MITQRVIDLDTLINSSIPQSKTPEYLVSTQAIDEEVNGARVRCFMAPRARVFSTHEVVYLAAALTTELDVIKKRIEELKLGRKVIQKLYAVRLDSEPWGGKPLTLPILCDKNEDKECTNDFEAEPSELRGNMVYSAYLTINGIGKFLKITTLRYPSHYEINITRLAGYKGIARYTVNTKLTP
ncbi:hypothetical protein [Vulcanisaeta sp. EB80]|uniref:hypothetical protein n=1 Tax=Vulcanisaeta sp. EB80 TaxID=1650660 RepID=UPI000C7E799A|nr:hypothetical protein [Vulcanisaeta sp. EB80]